MNRNLVGSTYGRFGINFSQNRIKGERHRLSPLRLYDCTYEQETFLAYLHNKRIRCTRRMPSLTCICVFTGRIWRFIEQVGKERWSYCQVSIHLYRSDSSQLKLSFLVQIIFWFKCLVVWYNYLVCLCLQCWA